MKSEKEIRERIRFLKVGVLPDVDSFEDEISVAGQIEALKWVLRKGE